MDLEIKNSINIENKTLTILVIDSFNKKSLGTTTIDLVELKKALEQININETKYNDISYNDIINVNDVV